MPVFECQYVCLSLYLYMSVCPYLYFSMPVSICQNVFQSQYVSTYVCVPVSTVYVSMSACLSMLLCPSLCVFLKLYLSFCLCLIDFLSACIFESISVCLSLSMFVNVCLSFGLAIFVYVWRSVVCFNFGPLLFAFCCINLSIFIDSEQYFSYPIKTLFCHIMQTCNFRCS